MMTGRDRKGKRGASTWLVTGCKRDPRWLEGFKNKGN